MIDRVRRRWALEYALKRIELFRSGKVSRLWDASNGQSMGCPFCSPDICQFECKMTEQLPDLILRTCQSRFALVNSKYGKWDLDRLEAHCRAELVKLDEVAA